MDLFKGQTRLPPSFIGTRRWMVRARPARRKTLHCHGLQRQNHSTHAGWEDTPPVGIALPFGSHRTMQGAAVQEAARHILFHEGVSGDSNFVVLDCIFQEATNTHWVMDGMFWKDCALCACTAEFRLYWLYQRLAELPEVRFSKPTSKGRHGAR